MKQSLSENNLEELLTGNESVINANLYFVKVMIDEIKKIKTNGSFIFGSSNIFSPFSNTKIVYISYKFDLYSVYRRSKLRDYLMKNYSKEACILEDSILDISFEREKLETFLVYHRPLIIVNKGFNYKNVDFLKYAKEKGCKIVYDKYDTDYEDEEIQKVADLCIASSKEIFNNELQYAKLKIEIPNGCDVKEINCKEKYSRKTAVYTGANSNKIDFKMLDKIARKNKDWDVKIFTYDGYKYKDKYKHLIFEEPLEQEQLAEELSKCHLGLNLIEYNENTKGQLSDKFFNYCNARIPTLIYKEFEDNYKEFSPCYKIFKKYDLDKYTENNDEVYNKILGQCDWSNRFDLLFKHLKEFNYF